MAGEDFVHVELTAAGAKMAGAGKQLRVTVGRSSFLFKVGESQRVTRAYEWTALLKQKHYQGQPVFQISTAQTMQSPATTGPHVLTGPGVRAFGSQHHPAIAVHKET
jgi:hypothetical protein